ncbi:MAG: Ig-like domain-containing protein [Christensenella sp.]|nr:Ig-like domain-containing protein [Christensenella sp.]
MNKNVIRNRHIKRTKRMGRVGILALVSSVLLLCIFMSGCSGRPVRALAQEEVVISSFSEASIAAQTVYLGTRAEEIGLPSTLAANVVVPREPSPEGEQTEQETEILEIRDIPVAWMSDDYDPDAEGTYLFNAQLQPGFIWEGALPTIQVEVQAVEEIQQTSTPEIMTTPEPSETPDGSISPEPSSSPEITPVSDPAQDYVVSSFINEPIEICIERGTTEENLPLPATLPAINGNGVTIEVPVQWTCTSALADERNSDEANVPVNGFSENGFAMESRFGYGPWVFTASIANPEAESTVSTESTEPTADGVLPEQTEEPREQTIDAQETAEPSAPDNTYTYAGEPITASVSILGCTDISSFCGISDDGLLMRFVIFEGGSVQLPDETGAFMSDGGYRNIPITWSGRYDTDSAGTYTLHMQVGDGFSGGGRATAEIVVLKTTLRATESEAPSGETSDGYSVQVIG